MTFDGFAESVSTNTLLDVPIDICAPQHIYDF